VAPIGVLTRAQPTHRRVDLVLEVDAVEVDRGLGRGRRSLGRGGDRREPEAQEREAALRKGHSHGVILARGGRRTTGSGREGYGRGRGTVSPGRTRDPARGSGPVRREPRGTVDA